MDVLNRPDLKEVQRATWHNIINWLTDEMAFVNPSLYCPVLEGY